MCLNLMESIQTNFNALTGLLALTEDRFQQQHQCRNRIDNTWSYKMNDKKTRNLYEKKKWKMK